MKYIIEPEIRKLLSSCIFKYGPSSNVERTLKKKTLGFSPLADFNDIYESEYRLTQFFENADEMDKWTRGAKNPFTKINGLAKKYLDAVRVSCFAHSSTNNLMWSLYSDHHKGVCYCFDFSNSSATPFGSKKVGWGNVIYSSLLPEIQVFQNSTTEGILEMLLTSVVLTKSSEWAYEQELRFFLRQDPNFLEYDPTKLKAIIIGRRTSDDDINSIKKEVQDFNAVNKQDVKVLFAHRVAASYELGVHQDKNFRDNSEFSFSGRIPVLDGIKSPIVTGNYK